MTAAKLDTSPKVAGDTRTDDDRPGVLMHYVHQNKILEAAVYSTKALTLCGVRLRPEMNDMFGTLPALRTARRERSRICKRCARLYAELTPERK